MERKVYGLTPERHAEVDAILVRAERYFERLLDELRQVQGDPRGHTVRQAEIVIEKIHSLRYALCEEQRGRRGRN